MMRSLLLSLVFLVGIGTSSAQLSKPNPFSPSNGTQNAQHTALLYVSGTGNYTYDFEIADNSSFNNAVRYYDQDNSVFAGRLKLNTTYYWRAKKFNSTDSSNWSDVWNFTTAPALVITTPNNNILSLSSYFSISACDHSNYQFQLDTDTLFQPPFAHERTITIPDSVNYPEFIYDSLHILTQYYCRWRSWEGTDTSAWTAFRPGRVRDTLYFLKPTGSIDSTNAIFSWATVGPNARYEYQIDTSDQFNSPVLISDTTGINYEHRYTLFDFDQEYHWRVRARNDVDTTSWRYRSFTTTGARDESVYLPFNFSPDTRYSVKAIKTADSLQVQWSTDPNFLQNLEEHWLPAGQTSDSARELLFGTTYYFRYRAVHQKDTGDWSKVTIDQTREYVSINSPINNKQKVSVHAPISWSDTYIKGTKWIQLQVSTSSSYNSGIWIDTLLDATALTSFSGIPLEYGTTYFVRTRLMHDKDTGQWSSNFYQHKFTTMEKPDLIYPVSSLLIPRNCQETLEWERDDSVYQYRIQLSTDSLFQQGVLDSLDTFTSGEMEVFNLLFGRKYFWRVKAVDAHDSSAWSDTWFFRVWSAPRLDLPKNKQIGVSTTPFLDWSSITGTSGYLVQLATDSLYSDIVYQRDTMVLDPFFHYVDENLPFQATYFWRVKVYHAEDTSEWSVERSFTTIERRSPIPAYPLQGQDSVYVSPTLHWERYNIANSYRLKVYRDSLLTDLMYDLVRQDTLSPILSFKPFTAYYWTVQGRNSNGQEFYDPSETMVFKTGMPIPAPTLLEPADGSTVKSDGATFKWSGVKGATYQIQYSASPGFSPNNTVPANSNSSYQTIGYGGPLYWRVRSLNQEHAGEWSEAFSVSFVDPTSVSELQTSVLNCYPNPVHTGQTLYFDLPDSELEQTVALHAADGRLILQRSGRQNSIILEGISPGYYTLILKREGILYRKKIMVQ